MTQDTILGPDTLHGQGYIQVVDFTDFLSVSQPVRPAFPQKSTEIWDRRPKDLTLPAKVHLFVPVLLNPAFTGRTVNEPAKTPCPKFPGGAFHSSF